MGQQAFSEIRSLDVTFTFEDGIRIAPNPVVSKLLIMNAIQYDADVKIDISATNGAVIHRISRFLPRRHVFRRIAGTGFAFRPVLCTGTFWQRRNQNVEDHEDLKAMNCR